MSGISIIVTTQKALGFPGNMLPNEIGLSSDNLVSHLPNENFNFWRYLQIPDNVLDLVFGWATGPLIGLVILESALVATYNGIGPTFFEPSESFVIIIYPHDGSSLYIVHFKGNEEGISLLDIPFALRTDEIFYKGVTFIWDIRFNSALGKTQDLEILMSINIETIPNLPHRSFLNNISTPQQRPPDVGGIGTQSSLHDLSMFEISCFEDSYNQRLRVLYNPPDMFG